MAAKSNEKWDRSIDYRTTFLKYNPGIFGKFYFCAYCGKPLTRRTMQVDHHIAINKVKHNLIYKLGFNIANFFSNLAGPLVHGKKFHKNVGTNVTYNLVPACAKCNNKKSDKGGLWIARGFVGGTLWKLTNLLTKIIHFLFTNPVTLIAMIGLLGYLVFFTPTLADIVGPITGFADGVADTVAGMIHGVVHLFGGGV